MSDLWNWLTNLGGPGGDIVLAKDKIKSRTSLYKAGGLPIRERMERSRIRLGWNGKAIKNATGESITDQRWHPIAPLPGPCWTDGYSNMLNPRVMPWLLPWHD
jgi:hypothetical protein